MSKILPQIHKKNLFLLPTTTEVAFNTTISPRFYCPSTSTQPNHSSLLKTSRCGYITGPMIYPYLILLQQQANMKLMKCQPSDISLP